MDFYKVALAVMIVIPVASPVLAHRSGRKYSGISTRKRGLSGG